VNWQDPAHQRQGVATFNPTRTVGAVPSMTELVFAMLQVDARQGGALNSLSDRDSNKDFAPN
jgi:hypothetical protein